VIYVIIFHKLSLLLSFYVLISNFYHFCSPPVENVTFFKIYAKFDYHRIQYSDVSLHSLKLIQIKSNRHTGYHQEEHTVL
jgi:hypothetical protein